MHPNERSEQARPGCFAPNVESKTARADYENSVTPKSMIVVLSQPRCGSTLLMRLVNLACMTHAVGDHDAEFYEAVVGVYRSFNTGHPTYKSIPECEREGVFCDTYRGTDKNMDRRLVSHYIKGILTRTQGSCFMKTGIIGFGNDITDGFVEMMREISEDSTHPIKLVFLTRNHDDIIKSFQTREHPGQKQAIEHPEQLALLLKDQLRQFKSAYELGDIMLRYEDLITDPKGTLLKLRPRHYPNDNIIDQVMRKKIR